MTPDPAANGSSAKSTPERKASRWSTQAFDPTWIQRVAAQIVAGIVRGISWTIRWRWVNPEAQERMLGGAPVIFAIWHNQLALCLPGYRIVVNGLTPPRRMAALVSASRDGALLAQVLTAFGVLPVRGSSSRRGAAALRDLVMASRKGFDLAITPDGPRGPRYEAAEGVISLARLTGMRIVPVSFLVHWKISLRSWDAFQIPIPFSVCDLILHEPIVVPRDSETPDEVYRLQLQESLSKNLRDRR